MKQFTSRNNTPISHSFLKQPNKNNSYFKACHVDYFTLKIIDCFDNINPLLNIYNFLKESIYVKQKDVEKYYWIANELVANMDNYSSNKSNHYFSSHHELEEFCKMKEKFEGI
jgi:hypothetical protein